LALIVSIVQHKLRQTSRSVPSKPAHACKSIAIAIIAIISCLTAKTIIAVAAASRSAKSYLDPRSSPRRGQVSIREKVVQVSN